MGSNKPRSRKEDLVIQPANGEVLVYDLRANRAVCLNQTSAKVWEACDGTRGASEIRKYMSMEFGTEVSADLIWLALDQLEKESLLEAGFRNEGKFEGVSRREVIRKIGLGSMIALPIVAGLVAPRASEAATCRTAGTNVGTASGGSNCSSPSQGTRNTACTTSFGSVCCSGSATATNCVANGGNPATFDCICA